MDGDNNSMPIYWSYKCSFILDQWTTEQGDQGLFALGCIISAVIAAISTCHRPLKMMIMKRFGKKTMHEYNSGVINSQRNKINGQSIHTEISTEASKCLKPVLLLYYLYYSLMHIVTMLLIMTMNGYVIMCMVIGLTFGYLIFEEPSQTLLSNEAGDLPVNCGCG